LKLIFAILLLLLQAPSYGQYNDDYYLYVGKVDGQTKADFLKGFDEYDVKRDSLLEIKPITQSEYQIEIRLYETPSAMSVTTCTVLYYDYSFKIKRSMKVSGGWDKNWFPIIGNPLDKVNADSVFKKLVNNGIFSLPEFSPENNSQILTKRGLIKSNAVCGVTDGCRYYIQIKLNDVYKKIYFSDMEAAQLACFPDNHITKRKKAIVEELKSNARLKKK
jgi:hypothetical protein